jgi:hypothetical protein
LSKIRSLFVALACAAMLAGCLSLGSLTGSSAGPAPKWVLNPPEDTSTEWYGVGEGPDRETARRAALKDVATKLRVTISGRIDSMVSDNNGKVERQARSRVSEDVQKTEFRNFSVEKTEQGGKGYYVLVKVDRPSFVGDIRSKLDPLDTNIEQTAASLEAASPIERFMGYQRLLPTIDKASTQAQLLLGAENGGTGDAKLKRYQALQQKAEAARSTLVFRLQSQPQDADIAAAVGTFVNENGMRADAGAGSGGNVLAVKAVSQQDEIYGSKVVKLNVNLNVRDDRGQSVASRDHEVSGTSRYDYKAARQNAVQALAEALRAEGPLVGLGFVKK